ncbi:MAG: hypothetical protein R3F59_28955 [Myxococcota bacterium]
MSLQPSAAMACSFWRAASAASFALRSASALASAMRLASAAARSASARSFSRRGEPVALGLVGLRLAGAIGGLLLLAGVFLALGLERARRLGVALALQPRGLFLAQPLGLALLRRHVDLRLRRHGRRRRHRGAHGLRLRLRLDHRDPVVAGVGLRQGIGHRHRLGVRLDRLVGDGHGVVVVGRQPHERRERRRRLQVEPADPRVGRQRAPGAVAAQLGVDVLPEGLTARPPVLAGQHREGVRVGSPARRLRVRSDADPEQQHRSATETVHEAPPVPQVLPRREGGARRRSGPVGQPSRSACRGRTGW